MPKRNAKGQFVKKGRKAAPKAAAAPRKRKRARKASAPKARKARVLKVVDVSTAYIVGPWRKPKRTLIKKAAVHAKARATAAKLRKRYGSVTVGR